MYDIMEEFGIRDRVDEEKVMLNYYYKDNWLHFGSIDNPEKIKSSSWSYIWMEEATEFSYEDYLLLKTRLRTPVSDGLRNQMILSFNPKGSKHWIKTKMIDKMTDIEEIVSTYQDNPFLDQDYIDELEDLKNQDINMWRVMAKGLWGELENVIYNNWDAESDRIPDGLPIIYGLDFGYNVPNALVKIGYKDLDLWEEELIYQPKLTITQLITKLKTAIPPKDRVRPIYADSADPAKIVEIRAAGFNIKPASKDVGPGIEFVKRCKVHVIKSSSEIIAEKSSYVWKTDSNSNVLDEPVKFNDHAQDAERYAAYTHIKKGIGTRVRWLN
jgi:phage terminase large subunit